jgi:hypothetical protein
VEAGQATKKYELAPGATAQAVDVTVDNVNVNQIILQIKNTDGSSPFRKSGSDAKVRIDNNGRKDVEAGVAVVVMDEAGNVLAAGSCGTKVGWLKAGERDTCSADFSYVFRNLSNARSVLVTLETRPAE